MDLLYSSTRNSEKKITASQAIPVSYTHLDVYKRQGYGCINIVIDNMNLSYINDIA